MYLQKMEIRWQQILDIDRLYNSCFVQFSIENPLFHKGYSKALYFAMIQIDFQFGKKLFREEKVKKLRNVFRIKKAIF